MFLVACTRLYKTLCRSVGRSVRRSVGYIYFRSRILLFQGLQRLIIAPAQRHATKIAVYTGGGAAAADSAPPTSYLLTATKVKVLAL